MASKCQNCGKIIRLKNKEPMCPYCGKNPYQCWNCGTDITGSEKGCSVCGFFVCIKCGSCGKNCEKEIYMQNIKNKTSEQIVEYFSKIKIGKIRMKCPEGIPISYAHGTLRELAVRIQGYLVKSGGDQQAFEKRLNEIRSTPINNTWTITQKKDDGTKGIEWREASNLSVCMGLTEVHNIKCPLFKRYSKRKKEFIIIDPKRWYNVYKRIEGNVCPFSNWEGLIIKSCPSCKNVYNYTDESFKNGYCSKCSDIDIIELNIRNSSITFCQLQRKMFIKKEVDNERGENS